MPKAKQLIAWGENRPGELGRIAEALAKAKVNISAVACWSAENGAPMRLLVSNPAKAKKVIQKLGVRVTEEEVLCVSFSDEPGVLGKVGTRLGAENINIDSAYASAPAKGKKANLILSVSDVGGALRALREL